MNTYFVQPDFAVAALYGDFSALSDADQEAYDAFEKDVIEQFGHALFVPLEAEIAEKECAITGDHTLCSKIGIS